MHPVPKTIRGRTCQILAVPVQALSYVDRSNMMNLKETPSQCVYPVSQ
jgi:hypothetical protein